MTDNLHNCSTCLDNDDCCEYKSDAVRDISKRCGLLCHSEIRKHIHDLEMQLGCSMMLSDDGDPETAYTQLRDELQLIISIIQNGVEPK